MAWIVIIEDDALFVMYLQYVLEQTGYDVLVTESGDEALALARDPATAAIIVDVSLRNTRLGGRHIDGVALSRLVKRDSMSSSVPVIVVTAHTMPGDRERFLEDSQADAFISKPLVDARELLDVIAHLVGRAPR